MVSRLGEDHELVAAVSVPFSASDGGPSTTSVILIEAAPCLFTTMRGPARFPPSDAPPHCMECLTEGSAPVAVSFQ